MFLKKTFTFLFLIYLLILPRLVLCENRDLQIFQNGGKEKFFTKSHSKAKGINLSIEYPNTWEKSEGERPNVVQKFSKSLDDGTTIICMILIKNIPTQASFFSEKELIQEMFSEETMKAMVGPNSKLLEHIQTKYDGQSGALSSFAIVQERSGIKIFSYILQHTFIYSKKMICIQCMVGGLASNATKIGELYKSYVPLFIQIGNSIVIQDKWEKETLDEEPSAMEITFGEYWWFTLLVSFFITWGIGLIPPILVRYVIIRRPLLKPWAIGLVIFFWIINIGIFTALGSQSKTHMALFLVAVVSYYILRVGHKKIAKSIK